MGLSLSWVMQCQVTIKKNSYFNCHQIYIRICPVFLKTHSRGHMSLQTNWMLFIKAHRKRGNRFHAFPMFLCGWGSLLKTFFRFICLGGNVCLTVYTFDLTDWEFWRGAAFKPHSSCWRNSWFNQTKDLFSFLLFFLSRDSDGGVGLTNFWIFIGDVLESTTGFPPKKTLSWNRDNNNEIPKILRLMVCL